MFSFTVMGAKSWRPSGTSEQPRKTIFSGGNFPISFMSKRISPDRAGISPETVLRRVVFPAPFAPMIVTISPARMCIVTFFSTFSRPYPDSTFLILSMRSSSPDRPARGFSRHWSSPRYTRITSRFFWMASGRSSAIFCP